VEVVLSSGRRRAELAADARLLGVRSYVFEAGAGLVLDGEVEWLTEQRFARIEESGAPRLLLERYAGRLEYHEPWHRDREVTHLFRGDVDAGEATAFLHATGLTDVQLIDNGSVQAVPGWRAFHLLPRNVSNPRAVARHMQARGYAPEDVLAVGDSPQDLAVADVVGEFWLMSGEDSGGRANVRVASERCGAGVYEAVITTLAERR
jgi:hypothetical protein